MIESDERENTGRKISILELSESLQNENIVKAFEADDRCIRLTLNHTYKNISVISDIDKKLWQKTVRNFRDAAEKKGVERKHIDMLDDTLVENYQIIYEISRNNNEDYHHDRQEEKEKQKYVYSTFKYSKNRKELHEAVIISGLPYFIKYNGHDGKLVAVERVEEPGRILRPPNAEEYPYIPYEFATVDELEDYLKRAKDKTTTIYSLYQSWKSIVKKYNDQDEVKLVLITMDIIWSYFQDLFPTTHYLAAIGDNGSGKSSIGETFEYGAYRCVNLTNPSAPNIFRVLGVIEPSQCTLILDEADRIDESSEMQSILKTGYRYGKRVPKVNTNSWKQEYFFTYCLKVFLAESSPNQWKSKGVLDRTLTFTAYTGDPPRLIEETIDPQGDPQRQRLLDELNDLRKLMLIYRMVHFEDPITDIDIGVKGRNMQLAKPYIQLFYNSPAQKEIEETLQYFLDAKNEKKSNSIEAMLLPLIRRLFSEETRKGEPILPIGRIWERIKYDVGEENSSSNPDECYTDYGPLYRNTITKIICDKFGAEALKYEGKRALKFNLEKLEKLEKSYDTQTKIHTTLRGQDTNNKINSSSSCRDGGDGYDGTTESSPPFDRERDTPCQKDHNKTYENIGNTSKDSKNITESGHDIGSDISRKEGSTFQEPSEPSPLSPKAKTEVKFW
jgi:hypothetical protein